MFLMVHKFIVLMVHILVIVLFLVRCCISQLEFNVNGFVLLFFMVVIFILLLLIVYIRYSLLELILLFILVFIYLLGLFYLHKLIHISKLNKVSVVYITQVIF